METTRENIHTAWQAANRAAINARLQRLRTAPDGTLYTQISDGYFLVVTKAEGHIRLWTLAMARPNTNWVQSQLNLNEPLRLSLAYTQAAMLALLWPKRLDRFYSVGLGGGSMPLVLHHYFPDAQIDCAEINTGVVEVAEAFFALPLDDERLHVAIEDGAAYLAQQGDAPPYDIIFCDAYLDDGRMPGHLTSEPFYARCRSRLTTYGVLAVNFWREKQTKMEGVEKNVDEEKEKEDTGRNVETAHQLDALVARLRKFFASVYVCPISGEDGNTMVFAVQTPRQSKLQLLGKAVALQKRLQFPFPFVEWVTKIREV